jgi:hypothetical protein
MWGRVAVMGRVDRRETTDLDRRDTTDLSALEPSS